MSEEEGESECRAVAGAERVLEAGAVRRRAPVAKVNGRVVDDELVAGCSGAAGIAVPSLGDRETGVEGIEVMIDALL